jgi:FixJ family two-component response regulator
LLVTDIVMPELGGLDLAEQIATLRPGIPILCISGYSDLLWRRDDLSVHFVQKPFAAGTVLKEVRKLLDARSQADNSRMGPALPGRGRLSARLLPGEPTWVKPIARSRPYRGPAM